MGQGWKEEVPVPLCALEGHGTGCPEGHGVLSSLREHTDLQEMFFLIVVVCL